MAIRKLLTLALALLLALTPLYASAEPTLPEETIAVIGGSDGPTAVYVTGEAVSGAFSLTLSDPQLSAAGETLDLTGLALRIIGAKDGANQNATFTMQLLANDAVAAAGALALNNEKLYVVIDGLSKTLSASLGDLNGAGVSLDAFSAPDVSAFSPEALSEVFDDIEFTPVEETSVNFYLQEGLASGVRAHITGEQLKQIASELETMFARANVQADLDAEGLAGFELDLVFYTDNGDNLRMEATLTETETGTAVPIVLLVNADEAAGVMNLSLEARSEQNDESIYFNLNSAPSPEYEGHESVDGRLTMNMGGESYDLFTISLKPEQKDAKVYDRYEAVVNDPSSGEMKLSGVVYQGETDEAYSMSLSVMGDELSVEYSGQIERAEDSEKHAGTLSLSVISSDVSVDLSAGLTVESTSDFASYLLDPSALDTLDITQMTQDDVTQLQTELQTVMISGMGALMQVPSVAALISQYLTIDEVEQTSPEIASF